MLHCNVYEVVNANNVTDQRAANLGVTRLARVMRWCRAENILHASNYLWFQRCEFPPVLASQQLRVL